MKAPFAVAAAVLQVLALGYIAGQREWIVRTGRTVWLRTAPMDPRDVMRGDYVRLEYEISRVSRSRWTGGLANEGQVPGQRGGETRVYASLHLDPDGLAEVTALSDVKPKDGLFLRGSLNDGQTWGDTKSVRFGLEAFFMEQGKALELENERSQSRRGVPLRMEVAVGASGIGVLKGYRWEALGIVVDFDTLRRTNLQHGIQQAQTVIVGAKVELKNHGAEPLALVDLPNEHSFGLVCDARWQEAAYQWMGRTDAAPRPEARDVVVLQPGQSHTRHLDLTQPAWSVRDVRTNAVTRLPQPLQELTPDWNNGFRIEYLPPSAERCATLAQARLIWHGHLRSRWFNPMGNAD